MAKSAHSDLTAEELDIIHHALAVGLCVKKAGRHSGHRWYCFDCQDKHCKEADNVVGHHNTFDSNKAIKYHLTAIHGIHWCSGYFEAEDAA